MMAEDLADNGDDDEDEDEDHGDDDDDDDDDAYFKSFICKLRNYSSLVLCFIFG